MTDELPPLPWDQSREDRQAARAARRRERRAERGARAGRGRDAGRPQIAPDQIVEAALRILDAEGLDALTVRHLASELGTGVMTLYWYIASKDELLALVIDRVFGEVETPPAGGSWLDRGRAMATSMRATLKRHPACIGPATVRPTVGPNALRLMDTALGIFRDAGFSDEDAADAYFTVSNFVTGFSAFQAASTLGPTERAAILDYLAKLPPGRYPNIVALGPRVFSASLDERFRFGLDSLLEGLAARIASRSAGAPPTAG
jgi:AcrR family transcriptional regulator